MNYRVIPEPKPSTPVRKCVSLPIVRYHTVGSTVVALDGPCHPSAILLTIRTVIVNAINRVFRSRSFTHVRDEILEFTPPFTNKNSTPSIPKISPVTWIRASSEYGFPDVVFWDAVFPVNNLRASTRYDCSLQQIDRANRFQCPTIASAQPDSRRLYSQIAYGHKSSESNPLNISEILACWNRNRYELLSVIHGTFMDCVRCRSWHQPLTASPI